MFGSVTLGEIRFHLNRRASVSWVIGRLAVLSNDILLLQRSLRVEQRPDAKKTVCLDNEMSDIAGK